MLNDACGSSTAYSCKVACSHVMPVGVAVLLLPLDASSSSDQQQRPAAFSAVAQQLADLESKVLSANNHITRLELELDVRAAEQQAVQQAAGVMKEQQTAAWDAVLQAVQQLHGTKQLTDMARYVLTCRAAQIPPPQVTRHTP